MDENKNRILLGDRFETSTVTHDLLIAGHGLEAEVSELLVLNIESLCRRHEDG